MWWIAPIVMGVVKGAGRLTGKRKAASLYRANKKFMAAEYRESVRRAEREFDFTRGTFETVAGASGVDIREIEGSSIARNRLDLVTEHKKQMDWMKKSFQMRRRIAKRSGQMQQSALNYQTWGSIAGGFANAYTNQNQSGMNTWYLNVNTSNQNPQNQVSNNQGGS